MTSCNIWFLTPPPPIVTHFITKALVLSSQKPLYPLPPKAVMSFMDDPQPNHPILDTKSLPPTFIARTGVCVFQYRWKPINIQRTKKIRIINIYTHWFTTKLYLKKLGIYAHTSKTIQIDLIHFSSVFSSNNSYQDRIKALVGPRHFLDICGAKNFLRVYFFHFPLCRPPLNHFLPSKAPSSS